MKIGFFGAGGTGKTTLAQALSPVLHLPMHPSITREVYAQFGKTQKDMDTMSQHDRKVIQLACFEAKLAYDAAHSEGVFDRTLLDHLAYLMFYCRDVLTSREIDAYVEKTEQNLLSYDLLVCFSLYRWTSSVDDGFRDASLETRTNEEKVRFQLFDDIVRRSDHRLLLESRTIGMRDEPVEDRVQHVRDTLIQRQLLTPIA